jgi:hypothetical protein
MRVEADNIYIYIQRNEEGETDQKMEVGKKETMNEGEELHQKEKGKEKGKERGREEGGEADLLIRGVTSS